MRTATRRASREPLSRLACGDSRPRQSDAIRLAEARFFASASVDVRDFVRLEQCGLSVQSRVGSHPFISLFVVLFCVSGGAAQAALPRLGGVRVVPRRVARAGGAR